VNDDKAMLMHVQAVIHYADKLRSSLIVLEKGLLTSSHTAATLAMFAAAAQSKSPALAGAFELPPLEVYEDAL